MTSIKLKIHQWIHKIMHQHLASTTLNLKKKVIKIMNNLDLVDAFRYLHSNLCQYTWNKPNCNKMARLVYFLVSNNLMDNLMEKCTWKLNSSLLRNKECTGLIYTTNR